MTLPPTPILYLSVNEHTTAQDFEKLKESQVTGKTLDINHVFGCVGREHFFINLKIKSTGRLVDAIVKTALGATCSSMPMEIQRAGEKFVPAKSTRKRSRRRGVKATIERIGEQVFKGSDGEQALLLGRNGEIDTYVYDSANGLVLDTDMPITDEWPSTGRPRLVSTRTESIDIDVGCEVAANLAVAEEVGIPLPTLDPEPTNTAAVVSSYRPALVSGSSSSSVGEDAMDTTTAATPSSVVPEAARPSTSTTPCTTGVEEQGVGVHAQAASKIPSPRRRAHMSKVSSHGGLPP